MANIFKKNRIAIETMIKDTVEYTVDKFRQSRTSFVIASAYGQIIFVLHNLSQLILMYLEDAVTELNIRTATRSNSVMGWAAVSGHNVTRAIGATGEISLLAKSPATNTFPSGVVVIPNYTKIKCQNNGKTYVLDLPTEEVRITSNGSMNGLGLKIIQGNVETQAFTGTGQNLQIYSVNFSQTALVDHFFVHVYVNGKKWKAYDSLYDMPRGAECYMVKTGISGGVDVIFGNGNFGKNPPLGAEIRVEYLTTDGEPGNLLLADTEEGQFKWEDIGFTIFGEDVDLNEVFTIKCTNPPDFGTNPEPLGLTRLIAPKNSRAYVLPNPDAYIIFLERFNLFSIIDAYATFDNSNLYDDKIIYLFLVPDVRKRMKSDENYFNIDESKFLLTASQRLKIVDLIERSGQKIVGTEVQMVTPAISRFIANISVIIYKDGPAEEVIKNNILNKLSDYFVTIRRRDRIPKSDIISIVESVDGVDSVAVSFISQKDEQRKAKNLPAASIDEFGDIIIGKNELPIIRGGWSDRHGIRYETGIDANKASCVNIIVKDTKMSSHNTRVNVISKNKIRST